MNRTTMKLLIPGLGLGAAAAYLLDPSRGRRRRALLRDQANHLAHVSMGASGKAGRDLKNRAMGAAHDVRHARSDERSREKLGQQIDVRQENWSPATRCVVGTTGGALATWAMLSRKPLAMLAGLTGLGMVARSVANKPLEALAGRGDEPAAVDLQKTFTVEAPLEQVYALWSHPENFPLFMSHLEEVRPEGRERYHWTARGPAGARVSWDAVVTERRENERLCWQSVDGSTVGQRGTVVFTSEGDGKTRVHLDLSYDPPAGVVGHGVASLFGSDMKRAMDKDLVRLKSLLETGKTTAHGREVSLRDVLVRGEAERSGSEPAGIH